MGPSRLSGVCLLLWSLSGWSAGADPPKEPARAVGDLPEPSLAEIFAALDLAAEPIGDQVPEAAAGRRTDPRPAACLAAEPRDPELVKAAWRQAGLEAQADRSRATRVRTAGFLPRISGGLRFDVGDRWDYRYEPGEPRVDQLHQDDGLSWDVGLSWDLSGMAYTSDELAVAKEALRRAEARRDLAVEVLRVAYARRAILIAGLPEVGSSERGQLDEASAVLDAWTGGVFAERWCGAEP